jgi:hypothetical protein
MPELSTYYPYASRPKDGFRRTFPIHPRIAIRPPSSGGLSCAGVLSDRCFHLKRREGMTHDAL